MKVTYICTCTLTLTFLCYRKHKGKTIEKTGKRGRKEHEVEFGRRENERVKGKRER